MYRFFYFRLFYLLLSPLFFVSTLHASVDQERVSALLEQDKPPAGVVFEIASADEDALRWAIPRIQQYIQRLRQKFPKLEVAVVTHGSEQFALQEAHSVEYSKVHDSVKALSMEEDVPVHICQTFAQWNDVAPEDFPEYVSVSATGPQQVNDYIDLGYTLVLIRRK